MGISPSSTKWNLNLPWPSLAKALASLRLMDSRLRLPTNTAIVYMRALLVYNSNSRYMSYHRIGCKKAPSRNRRHLHEIEERQSAQRLPGGKRDPFAGRR